MQVLTKGMIGLVLGAVALGPTIGHAQQPLGLGATASAAPDQGSALASVEAGDYKPLTVWATISLGTSYYTNPQKAGAINVAYSFDGPEFSGDLNSQALWNLAKAGKISFGLIDKAKNNIEVVPLAELQKRFPANNPSELKAVLLRDDVSVVADNKLLLGAASPAPIVKTAPPTASSK